jgi:hypothetical protein
MRLRRRHLVQAVPWLAAVATVSAARASATDLVVACDTTLGPAMRAAGARFTARSGVRIHVFPTPPAVEDGLIGSCTARNGSWRNRLVLAARHDAPARAVDAGPVAVSDPTPASDIDGPAVPAMIGSGWRIYNASPTFNFRSPEALTLGGDVDTVLAWHNDPGVASAIAWHFAAMWLLAVLATIISGIAIWKPVRTDPLEILFGTTIYVTNQQPRGFWTDRGYNWFSGI